MDKIAKQGEGMVMHSYNPIYWEERSGGLRLKASWGTKLARPLTSTNKVGIVGKSQSETSPWQKHETLPEK
jgi:hypothetical protein